MTTVCFVPLLSYPDPTPSAGLLGAMDLAAHLEASVHALAHRVDIPQVGGAMADILVDVAALSLSAEARSRTLADQLATEAERLASERGLAIVIEQVRNPPDAVAQTMAVAARRADVALLAIDVASPDHAEVAEAVLFGSGGPVIILPATRHAISLATVAVAWDGSRAASRALRDALPFLAHAERAVILTVEDDKPIEAGTLPGIVAWLAAHGIEARHAEHRRGQRSIGDSLQQAAIAEGADLLVMGAYGHSRLREFVLGGATRSVLAHCSLPVLMSH